ncbi:hypothetical protein C7475_109183 [Chitinophaga sp. S165]|nr:hypothetical protein C7475_109183 [Chitinophaga sp. S165]
MTKSKLMLVAIAILATVGTALAFKAQKGYGGDLRCGPSAAECTNSSYVLDNDGDDQFCAPILDPSAPCEPAKVIPQS